MKKILIPIIFGVVLTAFTTYSLLDTFVIASVGEDNVEFNEFDGEEEPANPLPLQGTTYFTDEVIKTDTSYSDPNIYLKLETFRNDANTTTIYTVDIRLRSLSHLRTAFANNKYGRNIKQKTSEMAKANNAICAINGDYYGAKRSGYVLRNSTVFRKTTRSGAEDLALLNDGTFEVFKESNTTLESIEAKGAYQVWSFGPALLVDGDIKVTASSEVSQAMGDNERCAIGIFEPLHYMFVVADGRTTVSKGLSLLQMAELMKSLGIKTGYNLDGGGSATLVFNNKLINQPTNRGTVIEERSISDIIYIGA